MAACCSVAGPGVVTAMTTFGAGEDSDLVSDFGAAMAGEARAVLLPVNVAGKEATGAGTTTAGATAETSLVTGWAGAEIAAGAGISVLVVVTSVGCVSGADFDAPAAVAAANVTVTALPEALTL